MTCTCLYNNTAEGASSIHIADARCPEHGGKRMTTAEVFADYLGLTPENAPWAWTRHEDRKGNELFEPTLTATSPLAPEPTPGWLETLMRVRNFLYLGMNDEDGLPEFYSRAYNESAGNESGGFLCAHPTHAVARALIAADPTLRAACERAGEEFKP